MLNPKNGIYLSSFHSPCSNINIINEFAKIKTNKHRKTTMNFLFEIFFDADSYKRTRTKRDKQSILVHCIDK